VQAAGGSPARQATGPAVDQRLHGVCLPWLLPWPPVSESEQRSACAKADPGIESWATSSRCSIGTANFDGQTHHGDPAYSCRSSSSEDVVRRVMRPPAHR
jgi:hypothetical protein